MANVISESNFAGCSGPSLVSTLAIMTCVMSNSCFSLFAGILQTGSRAPEMRKMSYTLHQSRKWSEAVRVRTGLFHPDGGPPCKMCHKPKRSSVSVKWWSSVLFSKASLQNSKCQIRQIWLLKRVDQLFSTNLNRFFSNFNFPATLLLWNVHSECISFNQSRMFKISKHSSLPANNIYSLHTVSVWLFT